MLNGVKLNCKLIFAILITGISIVLGTISMNPSDMVKIISFAAVYAVLGIAVLPVTAGLFGQLYDGGWFASKTLGMYLCGWLLWLFSSAHIIPFASISAWILLAVWIIVLYILLFRNPKRKSEFIANVKFRFNNIVLIESLFMAMFVFFCWYLGHKIPSFETERVMDFAIMNALSKTDYMPPVDMWAAGSNLNYYYFGQYIITYMGKLCFLKPEFAYTLGFNLIIPVVFFGIFVLVKSISERMFTGKRSIYSTLSGLIAAVSVSFSSNMHYFVFYLINNKFGNVFKLPVEMATYWFANSSRYIGYVPENTADRTIIEFPIYSYLIGDLHAHVINMMLVITILMAAYLYMISHESRINKELDLSPALQYILSPYVIIIGFALGVSSMSNSWDLPIYFVVCGSLILFTNIKSGVKQGIIYTLLQGVWVALLVMLVAMPFNLKFVAMVNGIGIVEIRSLLHQLIIVWGYPIAITAVFFISCVLKKTINTQEMFVFLVGMCATGLALMPEFVYAEDIYVNGFPRANTMFKLSYEAFILFGICIGITIIYFAIHKNKLLKFVALLGLCCFLCCAGYFVTASRQWMGNVFAKENEYIGIDSMFTFRNENGVESKAIQFLEDYVEAKGQKRPAVLEADGDSYTNSCRVSTLTGYPTIMGWNTHEWLWMDGYDKMNLRKTDATYVYTGTDVNMIRNILNNYGIDYVYIGMKEYERYGTVQNGIIESLGTVIYSQTIPDGTYIEIVEIDR